MTTSETNTVMCQIRSEDLRDLERSQHKLEMIKIALREMTSKADFSSLQGAAIAGIAYHLLAGIDDDEL